MTLEEAKAAAGRRAAEFIQDGMVVGLGTGSTAAYFIDALIRRCRDGLRIKAIASSHASADRASKGRIPILDINSVPKIDITVDGADEIDHQKRMIKGGGGAHTREKILAASSHELIIIVDQTKLVERIGHCKLPIEILSYGAPSTRHRIEQLGLQGQWRLKSDNHPFITDNGNPLFDIHFATPPHAPEQLNDQLLRIAGVVDTGFFFNLAGRVVIGHPNGAIEVRT